MPKGALARWDREAKAATCVACLGEPEAELEEAIDRGVAGASARRVYQRRHDKREQAIKAAHPKLGKVILALTDDPHSTRAWGVGAVGESVLGGVLERFRSDSVAVLHDRRIAGTAANIDHIVISAAGIFVIDAKRYRGKVEVRPVGSFFRPVNALYVGGRDRTKVIHGMARQVEAVKNALAGTPDDGLVLRPVVCFVDSEWGLFQRPIDYGGVRVLWPDALTKLIRSHGDLAPATVARLERRLIVALPTA